MQNNIVPSQRLHQTTDNQQNGVDLQTLRETIYDLLNPPVDMGETIKMVQDLQISGKNNTVLMMQSAVILNHINLHATKTLKIIDEIDRHQKEDRINQEIINIKKDPIPEIIEDLAEIVVRERKPIMEIIDRLKKAVIKLVSKESKSKAEAGRLVSLDQTTVKQWMKKYGAVCDY